MKRRKRPNRSRLRPRPKTAIIAEAAARKIAQRTLNSPPRNTP